MEALNEILESKGSLRSRGGSGGFGFRWFPVNFRYSGVAGHSRMNIRDHMFCLQ